MYYSIRDTKKLFSDFISLHQEKFDLKIYCKTFLLVHLSRRLKCTIVIMRCPSSVCRPSSVVVNFSHFQLLLWNRWTEFNETWQEARSQRPLQSLCFLGRSEKQDGRPGLWLAETFSTSPLEPLNGIQRNLTGSKISMSSTKFVFFGPIGKTRWPPWPLIGWDIFDFSSEIAERNWTKLDRKKDLKVLYQVCAFWADRKNKMPSWPIRQKGGTLYSGARYVALWASCFVSNLLTFVRDLPKC